MKNLPIILIGSTLKMAVLGTKMFTVHIVWLANSPLFFNSYTVKSRKQLDVVSKFKMPMLLISVIFESI